MKKTIFAALIAALAAPLAAQAEGAYIGGNVGRAEQKIEVDGYSFKESTTAYKLYGGYTYNQNFGFEVGFADLREAEKSGNGARIASEPKSIYLAATGTLPLNEQFSVFGKVGVASTHVKVSASAAGFSDSASDNRTSPYISVGASFALNKNVSFVAEYENFGKIAKDGGDHIKADFVSAGVRYSF
ncbi:OmpA-OmpF porin, OOP family [Duganella sp. CF402]|uniref:outer membrane beta-barrel protein n=1 Tax=unclassified Duganella TaxID=2636909 RepID=UPI0008AE6CE3|nr:MULTISPECIES: outer membrane beta-barrel protein [unclassified Duganella]RZT09267.1 OOP family OmpA-OmpF porin [Duganella sp. BK701]SEL64019.1 OmpA-OmpF porin, OOP family [Duganella sp. CF402]